MSENWWVWLLLIAVIAEAAVYRHVVKRAVSYPAGRWATGLAAIACVAMLVGAWLIDQAKAGIHPERLDPAQIILGVGMLVALMSGSAAVLLAPSPPASQPRADIHPTT